MKIRITGLKKVFIELPESECLLGRWEDLCNNFSEEYLKKNFRFIGIDNGSVVLSVPQIVEELQLLISNHPAEEEQQVVSELVKEVAGEKKKILEIFGRKDFSKEYTVKL
ncbi:MAG: hypothetical protein PHQ23_13330 [Candidatus Wallbacteria bacterium]|nr:hypothetical protein [Candidatus Wallbacteria bacterium]